MARTLYKGIELTRGKRQALKALAGFPDGTPALTVGPLNGGALSALSMMGLVERERRPGGFVYRLNDAGRRAAGLTPPEAGADAGGAR